MTMPLLRLPGRVLLPRATRLIRLGADAVDAIRPALRLPRLLAVGVDLGGLKEERNRAEEVFGHGDLGEPICICKVVAVRRSANGSVRLLIRGLSRGVRVSTSNRHGFAIEERPDLVHQPPTIDREHRREELSQLLECCLPGATVSPRIRRQFEQLPLGIVCDLIADCVGMTGDVGRQLLAATNVEVRSDILLEVLRQCHRNILNANRLTPPLSLN